jgi:uncharacterized protein with FMN-binding domain
MRALRPTRHEQDTPNQKGREMRSNRRKTAAVIGALLAIVILAFGLVGCGLVGCGQAKEPDIYIPGSYEGTGVGMGPITVTVTVDENAITAVDIFAPGETAGVGGREAIDNGTFTTQILETQSSSVDAISGATLTVGGVRTATESALEQARVEQAE